jgi:lysine-ketoglutarate reductase/saccharopine dehydrogenase-like protein (TIGR00300 family)
MQWIRRSPREKAMAQRYYEDVAVEGHLIDSQIVSKMMDDIIELGGEFETLTFDVGRTNDDPSRAVLRVIAPDQATLDNIVTAVLEHGAVPIDLSDVEWAPAPADGVFPEGFYSTTNMETWVRMAGTWVRVPGAEMDLGIRIDPEARTVELVTINDVHASDLLVAGHRGVRVMPVQRPREKGAFEFMNSAVSSEKPKAQIVGEVAKLLRRTKQEGRPAIAVVGPAVVHTGAAPHLARLFEMGFLTVMFGGNAVATHDVEAALYGTSLGVRLDTGAVVPGGHEHHLRAINAIRAAGGFEQAVAVRRADERAHVHAGQDGCALRARRVHPRRRSDARGHHRRAGGPGRDALVLPRRRRLPHVLDDAAFDRHRQHAACLHHHGLRGHQPRRRHEAGRSRVLPDGGRGDRRRALHRDARGRPGEVERPCAAPRAGLCMDRPSQWV